MKIRGAHEALAINDGGDWHLLIEGDRFDWPVSTRPDQITSMQRLQVVVSDGYVVEVYHRKGTLIGTADAAEAAAAAGVSPAEAGAPAASRVNRKDPADRAAKPRPAPAEESRPALDPAAETPAAPAPADGTFVNPYNFVPFGQEFDLGDAPGHDDYSGYSGHLTISITAETPLLLLDQGRAESAQDEPKHLILPVRQDASRRPILAASSLKGALRSAFEAVTNSRMAVFDANFHPAARERPQDALHKLPAVVQDGPEGLILKVVESAMPAQRVAGVSDVIPTVMVPQRILGNLSDRCEVTARVHLVKHPTPNGGHFYAWRASKVVPRGSKLPPSVYTAGGRFREVGYAGEVDGVLHRTGSHFHATDGHSKHDERLVPLHSVDGRIRLAVDSIPVDSELKAMWRGVTEAYLAAEGEPLPEHHQPGTYRLRAHQREWQLTPGRTLYVVRGPDGHVTKMSPALIGRAPSPQRPAELVDKRHWPMGSTADRLEPSPADRVFGWVADSGSYRGHVRIDPPEAVDTTSMKATHSVLNFNPPLELAPLSSPKPTQFRFYVQNPGNGWDQGGYVTSKTLRGRKVHVHQKGVDWNPATVRPGYWKAYRANNQGHKRSQTRSIRGWVKPTAQFTATIRFDSLGPRELGALLWLLNLPHDHFLKLGMGKPLGFGSVRVEVTEAAVLDEHGVRRRYEGVEPGLLPQDSLERLRRDFEEWAEPALLDPFRAAARGFDAPVHYPRRMRAPGDQQGRFVESFRWFSDNVRGRQLSLPELTGRRRPELPYDPR